MSASPMARQVTENKSIPKRVLITDPMDMPADYSSTPGGTLFSTTPGGSKIVYERSFLINLRNSPISKTPPKWDIPEGLMRGSPTKCSPTKFSPKESQHKMPKPNSKSATRKCPPNVIKATCIADDQDQFQMDM